MWAHPEKEAPLHGQRSSRRSRSGATSGAWTGTCSSGLVTPVCRRSCAISTGSTASGAELWERDFDPAGFGWLRSDDGAANVLAYARFAADGRPLVCVCNFSPVVRGGYRIGLPRGGTWRELLNTDAVAYGGSGIGNAAS